MFRKPVIYACRIYFTSAPVNHIFPPICSKNGLHAIQCQTLGTIVNIVFKFCASINLQSRYKSYYHIEA